MTKLTYLELENFRRQVADLERQIDKLWAVNDGLRKENYELIEEIRKLTNVEGQQNPKDRP